MFDKEQAIVYFKGKPKYALNRLLIEGQKLTKDEVDTLVKLHEEKLSIFEQMDNTDSPLELRELASKVTEIEFKMQETWHFKKDETYHEWYLLPKCTCPKIDNMDNRGTKYSVHTSGCPIHGG